LGIRLRSLLKRSPWQRRVSLAFGAYSALLTAAMAVYIILNRAYAEHWSSWLSVVTLSFLGALLAYYRPENLISWLLVAIALLRQTSVFSLIHNVRLAQGAEPTLGLLFWVNLSPSLSALTYSLLAFLFIMFPTGRLPSPRWRPAIGLLGLQVAFTLGLIGWLAVDRARVFAQATAVGAKIELTPVVENGPLSLVIHVREVPALSALTLIIASIALLLVILGLWSQVTRYRRGTGLERQQIKWVIYALVLWAISLVLLALPSSVSTSFLRLVSSIIPLGIAIPILRYRLYDIDILINRTLVYGLLTAALALTYYASVVALEQLVRVLTGGQSPLAIVASTLMIAALFFPLRRRIQDFIDRRFYRRKYDAARILARFAATSRANADLDSLRAEMLAVVEQTMQPRSAALWLKPGEGPAGSGEAE